MSIVVYLLLVLSGVPAAAMCRTQPTPICPTLRRREDIRPRRTGAPHRKATP